MADASSFDHQEILLDLSVVGEPSHRSDSLIGQVVLCGSVILNQLAVLHLVPFTDPVDLLVDLGTVMETLLSRAKYYEYN